MIDSNNKLKSLSKSLIESAKSIMTEKKTDKDLAKLAPPYDKVTHGDVLVGRKVYTHDQVKAHKAKKGIKEDADMVVVNAPVLADINGELAEVLKRDPRDKTVHIQLEGMKYVLKAGQYTELDEAVKNPYAVGMAAAMKSTGDKPPLKKSTITKAHEIAKKVAEEVEELDEGMDRVVDNGHTPIGRATQHAAKLISSHTKKKHYFDGDDLIDQETDKTVVHNAASKPIHVVKKLAKDYHAGVMEELEEGYVSHAQRKAVWAAREDGGKGHPDYKKKKMKEEVEELDELSTSTLQSYRKKARAQGNKIIDNMKVGGGDWSKDQVNTKTLRKRAAGANMSGKQLVKRGESLKTEEVEDLEELSKKTLGSYGSKALRAGLGGNEKRMKGANLASAKMYPDQYKNSPLKAKVAANEEVEDLDEKRGLWDNIHAKRERIKAGSGERMRKPGSKGAPTDADFKAAQNEEWEVKRGTKVVSTHKNKDDADVKAMKHPLNKVVAKEEVQLTQEEIENIEAILADLEEGRGRPPKEGSAAWHAKQKQNLDDMPALSVQLRKAASIDKPVTFMNGESKKILPGHIHKFNDHLDARKTSQDKAAFQKRAHKSHDEFVKAVSEPVPGRSKDTGEIVKYK